MRTVVFDLDGTLADTGADLIAAANACFEGLGHGAVLDPVADKATAFRGGRAMLALGFGRVNGGPSGAEAEAAIEENYPVLLDSYAANLNHHTRLYPGVAEALETLLAGGYRTAICTNKPEALAQELIARLGISGLFGALVGADTLPVRKPDPRPYREAVARAGGTVGASVLIGDTVTDRECARAAGVACALVTFGPEGRAVARLRPDALLDGYDRLPGLIARLIG